jgi:hypothetical protein
MASTALVRADIDAGLNLVRALDEADFGVVAALWLFNGDAENWRMVIGYKGAKKDLEKKYFEAARVSSDWRRRHPDIPILDLSKVRITSSDDRLIVGLRPMIRADGLNEIRFSQNMINGIYLEDALIYRLAA